MTRAGADGAAAAAQFFFALFTYSYATGDFAALRGMSHPECIYCAGVLADSARYGGTGLTTSGGLITTEVTHSTWISDEFYSVDLTAVSEPSQAIDETGTVVESFEGGSGTVIMIVLGAPGRWLIRAVETHKD